MSWQLASFTILALSLLGGFAWYERTRPDARIVALVGTLAAFACLGRIAFAAIPNVKPTTDIVIIAGFALGGAPGFVVGAVAGLTSNFFFGQGPWTPWQMAAWGVCGLIGAVLARIWRGRPIGRWPLAAVCGVVGFAFTAFQDFGDWVNYSDHSLGQFGAYVGKGVGFDFISAGGGVAFALMFGPALARSLTRFDRRLQVTWLPAAALLPALVAAVLLAGHDGGRSGTAVARAATLGRSAAHYLESAQNADGGLGAAPGQGSSQLYAGWAALGLEADGVDPATVSHGGRSLLAYVEAGAHASDPGSIERSILIAAAARADPSDFGGVDLVAALKSQLKPNGSVKGYVDLTAFAVLALRAAGQPLPIRSLAWLAHHQNGDGGWGYAAGSSSDVDDTGTALEALSGLPTGNGLSLARSQRRALAFLHSEQNRDGGFPSMPGGDSNAQSTAFAAQGIEASGANVVTFTRGGNSPLDYLFALTQPTGAVDYSRGVVQTPVWVTAEAELALAVAPFPLKPVPAPARTTTTSTTKRTPSPRPPTRQGRSGPRRHGPLPPIGSVHPSHNRTASAKPPTVQTLSSLAGFLYAVLLAPISR